MRAVASLAYLRDMLDRGGSGRAWCQRTENNPHVKRTSRGRLHMRLPLRTSAAKAFAAAGCCVSEQPHDRTPLSAVVCSAGVSCDSEAAHQRFRGSTPALQ